MSSARSGSSFADSAESATSTRYPAAEAASLSPLSAAWKTGFARSGTRNAIALVCPDAKLRARWFGEYDKAAADARTLSATSAAP
jgi:hypothetical protein